MRPILTVLILAVVAGPAAAQTTQFELDSLRIQQEAASRAAVAQHNELTALEARLRTEQAISDLRLQRIAPRLPDLVYGPPSSDGAPAGAAATLPGFPTTPDAILADSNRRVREATKPRR